MLIAMINKIKAGQEVPPMPVSVILRGGTVEKGEKVGIFEVNGKVKYVREGEEIYPGFKFEGFPTLNVEVNGVRFLSIPSQKPINHKGRESVRS